MFFCKCVHESTITCMFPCITPVSVHFWPPLEKGPFGTFRSCLVDCRGLCGRQNRQCKRKPTSSTTHAAHLIWRALVPRTFARSYFVMYGVVVRFWTGTGWSPSAERERTHTHSPHKESDDAAMGSGFDPFSHHTAGQLSQPPTGSQSKRIRQLCGCVNLPGYATSVVDKWSK